MYRNSAFQLSELHYTLDVPSFCSASVPTSQITHFISSTKTVSLASARTLERTPSLTNSAVPKVTQIWYHLLNNSPTHSIWPLTLYSLDNSGNMRLDIIFIFHMVYLQICNQFRFIFHTYICVILVYSDLWIKGINLYFLINHHSHRSYFS